MKRWKATIGILLVFAVGFLSGLTVGIWKGPLEPRPAGVGGPPLALLESVASELALDARQRAVVDDAMEEAREEFHVLREDLRPEMEAILKRARDKIVPMLSEEQSARLEELVEERKALDERRRETRP